MDGKQRGIDKRAQNAQTGGVDESDYGLYSDYSIADYSSYAPADYGTASDTSGQEQYFGTIADSSGTDSNGYVDNGDGTWFDPTDGSTYDEATGQWSYPADSTAADTPASADAPPDYSAQGLEDIGDGLWQDPTDGSVYDPATDTWTPGWANSDSFVDPISGTTFYNDGSFMLPDGTKVTADGTYQFEDGTQLTSDGNYVDASGQTWESMAYAGAPNVWQNTTTGDTWNMQDGTYVPAQFVNAVNSGDTLTYDQFLAQQKTDDPANYARLTQPTNKPGGSSSGGSAGGSGGGLSGGAPAAAAKGVTLDDLNKLLKTAATATQAVITAKAAGAPASQIATLQRQAATAAQAAAAAKAAGIATGNTASPISAFLKTNSTTLVIAGAALVALLLISGRRNNPTPAVNVAA